MSACGIRLSLLLFVCVLTTGCGKGPKLPATVPVTGTVTHNGNPLEGAAVTFFPKDSSLKNATGTTDASGKFEVETFVAGATKAKGAMIGEYTVTVAKMTGGTQIPMQDFTGGGSDTPPTSSPKPQAMMAGGPAGGPGATTEPPKLATPAKYADPQQSPLTASVKASGNQPFTFALEGE